MKLKISQGFQSGQWKKICVLAVILLVSLCNYYKTYKKSYNLEQEYTALRGEKMFHFMQTWVHQFESGIEHTNKIIDSDSVYYLGYDAGKLHFKYCKEFRDGSFLNFVKLIDLAVPKDFKNKKIFLAGFYIKILDIQPDYIRFRMVRELEYLRKGSSVKRFLRKMTAYVLPEKKKSRKETEDKKSKREKLKY